MVAILHALASFAWGQPAPVPNTPPAPSPPGGGKPGGPGAGGLVVRLEVAGRALTAPVVVHLVGPEGQRSDIVLNDSGQSPDVMAGDSSWSGAGSVSGTSAAVSLTAGDLSADAGTLSWSATGAPDISLVLDGTRLSEGAGLAGGAGATTPWGDALEPAAGGTPGGAATAQGPESEQIAKALEGASGSGRSDLWLHAVFAVCSVLLAVSAYFWFRGSAPSGPPKGVTLVPERGLFGVGMPPLVAGASRWVVSEGEQAALLDVLVPELARTRAVLVHGPEATDVPSVPGGPVYRSSSGKPSVLADQVDDLVSLHPSLAVVMLGPETAPNSLPTWLAKIDDLVPVLVVSPDPGAGDGPVVRCERVAGGWVFRTALVEVSVPPR